MSDPISRLDQFRADTPGAPMKSAAEVRRRGDQIRRRQRVLVTAGAAALAAVVAGPIIFLSAGFGERANDPTPAPQPSETPGTITPSPSGSAGPSTLTRAGLPVAKDLVAPLEASWVETETYDGEGSDAYNPCLTTTLGESAAEAAFRRDFAIGPSLNAEADDYGMMTAVVAEFRSPEAAEDIRADLSTAAAACTPLDATPAGSLPVAGGVISRGDINVVTYVSDEPGANARPEVATAVVVAEDRVLVLTRQRGAKEQVSPEFLQTSLQTSAVNAAHRMAGAEPPAPPESPASSGSSGSPGSSPATSSPGSSAPAAILSDAHLVAAGSLPGLPMEGESSAVWQQIAPQSTPTLYCQGAWLSSLKAAESVSREFRLENGGSQLGKVNVTVLEFATKPAADAAYGTVQGWLDACPASMHNAKLFIARPVESIETGTTPGVDRAAQALAEYAGDCGGEDCDATWYDHQTVAQLGTRLVLVTHAEAGGPCPPTRACPPEEASDYIEWDNRVAQTVQAAVGRAVEDLS
ncbi:hypothetical protein [Nocardioides albus]|uniref:PknH-like extracellular domain-containing protein n=1 Tax=Nocardioides albus TaxID=1841 RepID=A0A7W5A0R2_9ACTN|nr:hypothetical protein [Nocardioides albus]MBB3087379.1 hypothetical protein [Nocardioides albus]GGU08559.1 hypothetical protein GCM10007979_03030 [Nocardioides albus]